jgi:hypothetical protein
MGFLSQVVALAAECLSTTIGPLLRVAAEYVILAPSATAVVTKPTGSWNKVCKVRFAPATDAWIRTDVSGELGVKKSPPPARREVMLLFAKDVADDQADGSLRRDAMLASNLANKIFGFVLL